MRLLVPCQQVQGIAPYGILVHHRVAAADLDSTAACVVR